MSIREELIQHGLWDQNDPRDPSTDKTAAGVLQELFKLKFGVSCWETIMGGGTYGDSTGNAPPYTIFPQDSGTSSLTEATREMAICKAALITANKLNAGAQSSDQRMNDSK